MSNPPDRGNHPNRKVGFLDRPRGQGKIGFSHPGGTYRREPLSIRQRAQDVAEKVRYGFTGRY